MRYRLRNGRVIFGTEVGRDAEAITVVTDFGVVRLTLASLTTMDTSTHPPHPGLGLMIAGGFVFATLYVVPAVAAQADPGSDRDTRSLAWLPIVGPLVLAGDAGEYVLPLLVWWGMGQLTGAVLFIVGASMSAAAPPVSPLGAIDVMPVLAKGFQGFALRGAF